MGSSKAWMGTVVVAAAAAMSGAPAQAQWVERVSLSTNGAQGDWQSRNPAVSDGGRYIVFESDATTLVDDDSNGQTDVFVHDRHTGTTTRVSLTAAGGQVTGPARLPAISGDGRRVVFTSFGALHPDSVWQHCYVKDLQTGAVDIIDRQFSGSVTSSGCSAPTISRDGRRVAFASSNINLLAPGMDTNGWSDVFVRDLNTSTTVRVNLGPDGVQGNQHVDSPRISANGTHVIYATIASNLVANDTNGVRDVFVSTLAGATQRVSLGSGQLQPVSASLPIAGLSGDGSVAAFSTKSSNLPGWGQFAESILYVRVPAQDHTIPISVPPVDDHEGWAEEPDFSANGRWLAFRADDALIGGIEYGGVYVLDRLYGELELVSRRPNGAAANGNMFGVRISPDGRGIVWFSNSTTLVPNDTNGTWDVFYADNPLWDDTIFANGFQN